MAGIPCSRATLISTPVYSKTSIVLNNLELDLYKIVFGYLCPYYCLCVCLGLSQMYTLMSLCIPIYFPCTFTGCSTSVCPYNYGHAVYTQLLALLKQVHTRVLNQTQS